MVNSILYDYISIIYSNNIKTQLANEQHKQNVIM